MPALSPALSLLAAFSRMGPPKPLHTFFRSTAYRLSPPRPLPYRNRFSAEQDRVLASGRAEPRQLANLLCERRHGTVPTIVLGGFVPDSTEQVFLLRGYLLRQGSVYYLNYPRAGFSAELLCAQLDDLVAELNQLHGQRPVIFSVSFGAGLVIDWLRRAQATGRQPDLAGILIVSPVASVDDVLDLSRAKPSTLLGRAVKPFIDAGAVVDDRGVEKARLIFSKMFEAGAQNRASWKSLLTGVEFVVLRDRVLGSIHELTPLGAFERVQAMREMPPLSAWAHPNQAPLSYAPARVLFAEKENAVLVENAPTRVALDSGLPIYFPNGDVRLVTGRATNAVQHASLIFHYFQFLPHIVEFYRGLKTRKFPLAA